MSAKPMRWFRVRAKDKLAFREDLQADPTLTDLQKRMISVIAQNWDGESMRSECSLSYIAAGAGTTKKMVNKYASSIVASGRVSIKRAATFTESTLWEVNWFFRGSAWVRSQRGGPTSDCRKQSPSDAQSESPSVAPGESPSIASPPSLPVPQAGDQFLPKGRDRRPMEGARPDGGAPGAPLRPKLVNPHKGEPGFALWKIVHAEYAGNDQGTFVAHLRSGSSRKFVLRCDIDSEEYGSIDEALCIDGEAARVIGERVQMSTNRTGAKTFMRGGPLPWTEAAIVDGEEHEDGSVSVSIVIGDDGEKVSRMLLSSTDAGRLAEACGGEPEVIGARVRYRLLPDDSMEFQRL